MNIDTAINERIETVLNNGLVWGESDCCMFVANIMMDLTGIDYAKNFRGKYRSRVGAYRFLKRNGGIDGLLSKILNGFETDNLKKGDIVLFDGKDEPSAGIFNGRWVIGPLPDGVGYCPPDKVIKQWRLL